MINRSENDIETQLNTWIVKQFIEAIYNRGNINSISEFIARPCRFWNEFSVIGDTPDEIQLHFIYAWINRKMLFENVQYTVDEIIANKDVVSVKLTRHGTKRPNVCTDPNHTRWEMFQLKEGRIRQRWIAQA